MFVVLQASLVAAAGDGFASRPLVSIRADHMVLDVALDGPRLLVATQSGRVDAYDRETGDALPSLHAEPEVEGRPFPVAVRSLAIAPGGGELAVVTSDGLLRRYALDAEAEPAPAGAQLVGTTAIPGLMLVTYMDAKQLLAADMRGELALLDLAGGVEVYRRQLEYDPVYAMALSPDRSLLALAFRSSRVQVVSPQTGETQHVLKGHLDSVFDLDWISARKLVTAGKDKRMLEWDLFEDDPRPHSIYRGDHYITALGIDRRGGRVALPLEDHDVGLIELADGTIGRRLQGHTAPVQTLVFIDEGRKLVSAGYDARVFVWDLDSERESSMRR
ncbi:MAG: PQQ-binding-like beta-propeller repeat protein [bacterium]|nr:PQQ-binding-like beta-propeller repeat protein [bacterium]